jgi:hypothetical protein
VEQLFRSIRTRFAEAWTDLSAAVIADDPLLCDCVGDTRCLECESPLVA